MNRNADANHYNSSLIFEQPLASPNELKNYLVKNKLLSASISSQAYKYESSLLTLSQMVRKQSALNPNLGIALTMHHHIVMVLAKYSNIFINSSDVINNVLYKEYLVASAFSEGKTGISVFEPSTFLKTTNEGIDLHGYKRPCTLSSIADYYVLSANHKGSLTLLSIPSNKKNITVNKFWISEVFTCCDNNEVVFNNVPINNSEITTLKKEELGACLIYGLSQFNFLASSTYIGIADRILDIFPERLKILFPLKIKIVEYKNINNILLEQMASICSKSEVSEHDLNSILTLRYLLEANLDSISNFIFDNCGGVTVMSNPEIMSLTNHLRMFKYHPTSKFQFYSHLLQEAV